MERVQRRCHSTSSACPFAGKAVGVAPNQNGLFLLRDEIQVPPAGPLEEGRLLISEPPKPGTDF